MLTPSTSSGLAQVLPVLQEGPSQLETFAIFTGLVGGLALFLYGMGRMSNALKAVAGERMRAMLAILTTNRFMGATTGAFVTAVIQSSSVTTVLLVGFVSAGLMSMTQSVGVIMGANVGTTITAQIIAFKITEYALLLVASGFAIMAMGKRERTRLYGTALLGLGLIFFGMEVMAEAMSPLRTHPPFVEWMVRMNQPALGILAGVIFTALVQSSSATTGVVIVMASQGFLSLQAGIALIFGANIGTCVTAMLAAVGRPREALRAAVVHVVFNVAGVLIWLSFIPELAELVSRFSPSAAAGLTGAARLGSETPRQIANAHTVFNVANTLVFIGFTPQLARFVERLVPDRPLEEEEAVRSRYLDVELLDTPSLALDRVRLETLRMGDRVKTMLANILPAMTRGTREDLAEVEALDDEVDALHGYVVTYLGEISKTPLTEPQRDEFVKLMAAVNNLENIGDIIERNLANLGRERIDWGVTISPETLRIVTDFHRPISDALDAAVHAITAKSPEAVRRVKSFKGEIARQAEAAALHGAERLVVAEPNRLAAYKIETDILENLKRIYYFCRRMARDALPRDDRD